MNKAELILEIQKLLGKDATKACAEKALNVVLAAIKAGVKKNKKLQLIGFGTFSVAERKARMGIAAIDPNACLSWQGLRCEVCYRDCPLRNEALSLKPHPRELSKHAVFVPVINPDHCTGCGLCVYGCPTQVPAINIIDPKTFLGRIGEHYRLGWLEDQPHHPGNPADKKPAPQKLCKIWLLWERP